MCSRKEAKCVSSGSNGVDASLTIGGGTRGVPLLDLEGQPDRGVLPERAARQGDQSFVISTSMTGHRERGR
jgi:hypothetical protein